MSTLRDVWGKHGHLISAVGGTVVGLWLLYSWIGAALPFLLGLVLAYLLLPVVSWLEVNLPYPRRWQPSKRVFIISMLFVLAFAAFAGMTFLFITTVAEAFTHLIENSPQFITTSVTTLQGWTDFLRERVPPDMREQVDGFVLEVCNAIIAAIQHNLTQGISTIPSTLAPLFSLVALPLFLFYLLKDAPKLNQAFYSAFPSWLGEHVRNIVSIIEGVLGRYIRAALLEALIVGIMTALGLALLGMVHYAPALGALAAVTELIPTVGPWIGGGVAVIVALAIAPDKAIWVAVLALAVQLLENNLLLPRIQGAAFRIHPALIIVLLVFGGYLAGLWGMVLAVPLTATGVEIYKYVRQKMKSGESPAATGG